MAPDHFAQLFSTHGTIMIFFVAMPLLIGLITALGALLGYFLVPKIASRMPRCLPHGVRLFDMGKFKVCCSPPCNHLGH